VIGNLGGSREALPETEFVVALPNDTEVRPVRAAEARIGRGRSARLPDWYGSIKPERKRFWQR
jgi:hypothetical protein